MITILHNPRCSKSRAALALTQQFAADHDILLTVVDYQTAPLQLTELRSLQQQLGLPVRAMIRDGEALFDTLQLAHADDETLLAALASHPLLLQRPIVIYQERAVIGRPPELLHALLRTA
ncbi:MAG: arsenate reductase (glutaredoxin) [Oxalobacteraceae bacterium]|nr:arsenate reductase (glutaredoxin) [Oxalobacteraceae bacterium]